MFKSYVPSRAVSLVDWNGFRKLAPLKIPPLCAVLSQVMYRGCPDGAFLFSQIGAPPADLFLVLMMIIKSDQAALLKAAIERLSGTDADHEATGAGHHHRGHWPRPSRTTNRPRGAG